MAERESAELIGIDCTRLRLTVTYIAVLINFRWDFQLHTVRVSSLVFA